MDKYYLVQTRGDLTRDFFTYSKSGLNKGQAVLVESDWGQELGWVNKECEKQPEKKGRIIKVFSQNNKNKEIELYLLNAENKEKQAFDSFKELIKKYKLDKQGMKAVKVYLTFDQKKIIFYYTAPARIDFRELLKELIASFSQVVRLQQISYSQSAIILGGIGICGQEVCCHKFLYNLPNIEKDSLEELDLYSGIKENKLRGLCGRVRCCLSYELPLYNELNKNLPKIGQSVKIRGKQGRVISKDILNQEVIIETNKGAKEKIKWQK